MSSDEDQAAGAKRPRGEDERGEGGKKRRLSKQERKKLVKDRKKVQQAAGIASHAALATSTPAEASETAISGPDEIQQKRGEVAEDAEADENKSVKKTKKLGAWFPTAQVMKSTVLGSTSSCALLLFYQYATPAWSKATRERLVQHLIKVGEKHDLGGRIRVACEGLNATVSGTSSAVRELTRELQSFDAQVFANTDWKFIDALPSDRAFKDLKILPVNELVFYGVGEEEAPLGSGGVHLPPADFHSKLEQDGTVVIDVRNHYEADIGRFDGQAKVGGATYIDPHMRKSTDFPAWLAKEETKKQLEGKDVLMYCTGGVRCERASAFLKRQIGDSVKGVFQLQGGVERYFKEFPDGGHWNGKNYVFDKREAVGVDDPVGVGGVVRKDKGGAAAAKKAKKNKKNRKSKEAEQQRGRCCVCGEAWDRYIGKKKCWTCGVPVLMCDKCMSLKPDKTPGKEASVRCPLCVSEGVTVPASEADLTDNGKQVAGVRGEGGAAGASASSKRRASSVLKWGGGHAAKKKERRQAERGWSGADL